MAHKHEELKPFTPTPIPRDKIQDEWFDMRVKEMIEESEKEQENDNE